MELIEYVNRRVLIVDDQKEIHDDFTEMLTSQSSEAWGDDLAAAFVVEEEQVSLPEFELLHARSGEEACEIVRTGKEWDRPIAVAYIDVRMPPGVDGIETIRRVREVDRDVEIVIMTAYTDRHLPEIMEKVEPLHKVLYIRKPFGADEIQQTTMSLVGKWNVEQELAAKRRQLVIDQQRLEAVLDATGEAMAMYDLDGRLVFANTRYEKLADLTEGELKELSPDELTTQLRDRFRDPDLSNIEGGFVLKDGGDLVEEAAGSRVPEQRLFYRSTAPVNDGEGEVIGSLHVYRDLSKEVEVERMKAEVLRLRTELDTTHSFDGMVGASAPMQRVYALMRHAAESDITVLVRGESGTGKELVARSFHSNSPRRAGPFLAINCAAIPETLIESELFGHERGAFTGATRQRLGAFERASGGTLLLDEIGDMERGLQGKLLRVLQEREIQRVGGNATIPIDVRVIVATHQDLEAAVKAGDFREDLFYRIAAFPIVVPPLRQHREDIPLLAHHFLNKHAERSGRSVSGISTAALRLLLQYDWPGNVRELEHAIERAALLEKTSVLQAESLPPQLLLPHASTNDHATPASVLPLAEVERQALARALEASGNNITQAAQALGINRVTLHRKLKRHGLSARS